MNQTASVLKRSPLSNAEQQVGEGIRLVDLTPCARIGFKGIDTVAWLDSCNIEMPDVANRACALDSGGLIARLSETEFLLIDRQANSNTTMESLRDRWSLDMPERTYLLERCHSHASIEINGERASDMFAKICGVDLRVHKFANMSVAQTSVAKLNAIIIRADKGQCLSFLLFADIAAAEYLWKVVLDAVAEFN